MASTNIGSSLRLLRLCDLRGGLRLTQWNWRRAHLAGVAVLLLKRWVRIVQYGFLPKLHMQIVVAFAFADRLSSVTRRPSLALWRTRWGCHHCAGGWRLWSSGATSMTLHCYSTRL